MEKKTVLSDFLDAQKSAPHAFYFSEIIASVGAKMSDIYPYIKNPSELVWLAHSAGFSPKELLCVGIDILESILSEFPQICYADSALGLISRRYTNDSYFVISKCELLYERMFNKKRRFERMCYQDIYNSITYLAQYAGNEDMSAKWSRSALYLSISFARRAAFYLKDSERERVYAEQLLIISSVVKDFLVQKFE